MRIIWVKMAQWEGRNQQQMILFDFFLQEYPQYTPSFLPRTTRSHPSLLLLTPSALSTCRSEYSISGLFSLFLGLFLLCSRSNQASNFLGSKMFWGEERCLLGSALQGWYCWFFCLKQLTFALERMKFMRLRSAVLMIFLAAALSKARNFSLSSERQLWMSWFRSGQKLPRRERLPSQEELVGRCRGIGFRLLGFIQNIADYS